jgi:hypothetical protein
VAAALPYRTAAVLLLRIQSIYYGVTGAWPVVHMPSFETVTGPKTDDWLVHMVGLLTVAIAVTIWPRAGRVATPVRTLAVWAAAAYLVIDVVYTTLGVISPIYLLDAAAELGLIAGHVVLRPRKGDPGE